MSSRTEPSSARTHGPARARAQGFVLTLSLLLIAISNNSRAQAPEAPPGASFPDISLQGDTPRFEAEGAQAERIDESQFITRALKLRDVGLAFDGTWLIDNTAIAFGGLHPGYIRGQNLLNLGLIGDTDKLLGWKGGTFLMLFQSHRGINAHTLTGDEMFVDELDAAPNPARGQISALWYQQLLWNRKIRLKIGKVDANEDFAYVKYGGEFIHGAFGHMPTIFMMPTYPDPAMSVNAFIYPTKWLYAGVGIYDGSFSQGITTGMRGPEGFFRGNNGYFVINEVGLRLALGPRKLAGRFALGYWRHNGRFLEFEDEEREALLVQGREQDIEINVFEPKKGTGGWYCTVDQQIWRESDDPEKDEQGIGVFYQYGSADPRLTIFQEYHGMGLCWTGLLRKRDEDSFGFGIAFCRLSQDPLAQNLRRREVAVLQPPPPSNEIAYQWFYRCKVNNTLAVEPGVTYIHDPGQDRSIRDPLAFTLRVVLDF